MTSFIMNFGEPAGANSLVGAWDREIDRMTLTQLRAKNKNWDLTLEQAKALPNNAFKNARLAVVNAVEQERSYYAGK